MEKHIQLMHGIKEAERKSEVELSSMEETTAKDQVISSDTLNRHLHHQHLFRTYNKFYKTDTMIWY